MEEINLTKEAKKLMRVAYKYYLKKRKSGVSKRIAKNLVDSHFIHTQLLPSWTFEDVDDTCRELSRAELLNCQWMDDIAGYVRISDKGIAYMENRFKNGLRKIVELLTGITTSVSL